MATTTWPVNNDEINILISGGNEKSFETLKDTMLSEWMYSNYHRVMGAKEMLDFLIFSEGTKSTPPPDLIFLLFSGADDEQIELVHDLCMVLIEKKVKNMVAVLTDGRIDDDQHNSIQLVGADLVMHIDDIVAKKQDIMDLVINGWFRS